MDQDGISFDPELSTSQELIFVSGEKAFQGRVNTNVAIEMRVWNPLKVGLAESLSLARQAFCIGRGKGRGGETVVVERGGHKDVVCVKKVVEAL